MASLKPNTVDKPVDWRLALLMILIPGSLWGLSSPINAIILRSFQPLSISCFRALIALVPLYLILRWRGAALPTSWQDWWPYIVLGTFNNTIPYFLTTWGQLELESGLTSILVSLMPLCTVLFSVLMIKDEQPSRNSILGIAFGLIGVIILIGPSALRGANTHLVRQLAVLCSALSYGYAAVYARRYLRATSDAYDTITAVVRLISAQYLASIVTLFPFVLWFDRPWTIEPRFDSVASLLFVGLVISIGATMFYYVAIDRIGATFASMTIYLIPINGVLWSAILLGESVSARSLLALGVILLGVAFANRKKDALN